MVDDHRAPVGLLVAAIAAVVLSIAVFMPWYGLTVTASGVQAAQEQIATAVQQYGNAAAQAKASTIEARYGSLVGRQIATVSAYQVLKQVRLMLLVLAGAVLLATLLRLADRRELLWATGGHIAYIGGLAAFLVMYRIYFSPGASIPYFSLSVDWGAWLAFASAAAIVVGGLTAGSEPSRRRPSYARGPGPPPIGRDLSQGRDVSSPLAMFREKP